jgi:hypothetical protein
VVAQVARVGKLPDAPQRVFRRWMCDKKKKKSKRRSEVL